MSKLLNLNRYRKIFSQKNHLKKHLTKYAPESLTLIIFFVKKYNTEKKNYLVNLMLRLSIVPHYATFTNVDRVYHEI